MSGTTVPGVMGVVPAGPAASTAEAARSKSKSGKVLSLFHLLDPEVLADPYPLFHRLRTEDPVHWDPYLHAWIVTRYVDVIVQRWQAYSGQEAHHDEDGRSFEEIVRAGRRS